MSEKTETNKELLADFPPSQSQTSEGERMVVAPYEEKRLDGVKGEIYMLMLDEDRDIAVKRSQLILTKTEALELIGSLQDLLSQKISETHSHISDSDYQHGLTVATYDEKDVENNKFSERIMGLIINEMQ